RNSSFILNVHSINHMCQPISISHSHLILHSHYYFFQSNVSLYHIPFLFNILSHQTLILLPVVSLPLNATLNAAVVNAVVVFVFHPSCMVTCCVNNLQNSLINPPLRTTTINNQKTPLTLLAMNLRIILEMCSFTLRCTRSKR